MNIGLVTVYYTENCGSVLQAFALKSKIEELGGNCTIISTQNKYSGHSYKRFIKNIIKAIRYKKSVKASIYKYYNYEKFIKNEFKVKKIQSSSKFDAILIGSDTVWDAQSEYFLESKELFWGSKFTDVRLYSYAASISNCPYQVLDNMDFVLPSLQKMKKISVRDNYTLDYVKSRTNKDVYLNCDPTFFFNQEFYLQFCKKINDDNYLLLYLFDEPTEEEKKNIIDFARKFNLKIISLIGMGKYISFADEYVESTIENFLSYFYNASYIVTNTFHGSVFSIIFNKQFVVLDYKKNKIIDLLDSLDLSDRINSVSIEDVLLKKIDCDRVNNSIKIKREKSEDYLRNCINEK